MRAEMAWRDEVVRFQAETHMRFLLGRSSRAGDVESLVKPYLVQFFTFNETLYRPWLVTREPIEGLDKLERARAKGRGVLLHFLHHGQYCGIAGMIGRRGFPVHAAAHPLLLESRTPDERQQVRLMQSHGSRLFPATGSYAVMLDLLSRGEIVAVSSDVRGSTAATFLGRDIMCASGVWRLALDSGATVAPLTVRPEGLGERVVIEDPVDPRTFTDGPALQQAVLRVHEPSVLAWPEAMRRPSVAWPPDPKYADELHLDDPRLADMRV